VRTHVVIAATALALALPVPSLAEGGSGASPVLGAALGGGGELGLKTGHAGVMDLEALAGLEFPTSAAATGLVIRPELALSLGLAPDFHLALRPGARVAVPGTPIWLRAAIDWSNARGTSGWRWLLLGLAWEIRMTGQFGLYAEADAGIPLSSPAGTPLLFRAGATFRP
jgi:hypothetical protein